MVSLYNIISKNEEWILDRLNFYVSKVDCFRNTGFNREKQRIIISQISRYICDMNLKNVDTCSIENDDEENKYRFANEFLYVYSSIDLGINRNNILRMIKYCKKVYFELVLSIELESDDEKGLCNFLQGFFDNFETSIFDSWYSLNSIKETGNFTYDEFRDIALRLSETAALGILVVKGRKVFYINKYMEDLLGYDVYELNRIDLNDMIDSSYREFLDTRRKLCEANKIYPKRYTIKVINKFGIEKWLDVNEKAISNNIILLTIANITAYKQVQEELVRYSESLRSLIDAMTDFVCFKDEHGRWLEANEVAVDLYDLRDIDYRGMTNSELAMANNGYYKEAYGSCNNTDEITWECGQALEYEEIINKPDGRRYVYEMTKVPLYYEDGRRKAIVALGKDVTNKKAAEDKLRESEERYRMLFDLSPDAIFIKKDDTILLSNKSGIRFLGKEALEEVQGKCGSEFISIHPDYKPDIEEYYNRLAKIGLIPPFEEKFIRKNDGKVLECETTCSVFPYEGENTILVITRDISERKKTEELKIEMSQKEKQLLEAIEYDRIRNEFFTNISHELRTPLNVLLGTVQLFELMSKKDTIDYSEEKFLRYTMIMKQNCYRLVKIVNNLIDITKIDSGYFMIHMSNNNIIEIVENIVLSIVDYARNKGISTLFDTDFEEKVIGCDPDNIERIMLNLLSNSIKFTEDGGKVEVRVFGRNNKVMISVKDTGIGIPEDKIPLVFDRFIQVDRSLTRSNEGSGIGLSMVKSLVEMQNGKISVKSKLGEGSEFIIELPDKLVEEGSKDKAEHIEEQSKNEKVKVEFSDIYF